MMSEDEPPILQKEEKTSVKDEKNEDDKNAEKENIDDKEINSQLDSGNNEMDILQENIDPSNPEKLIKFRVPNSMQKKKLRKVKRHKIDKEVVENGGKEKKSYYVRKEKKKKMFQCSSCDYSSDYHSQIDQHTFKHHSSLCTQVLFLFIVFKKLSNLVDIICFTTTIL